MVTRSLGLTSSSDLAPRPSGSEGCASTGATTTGSTIIARAKPPVRHMPMTPTPGPPLPSCSTWARSRSHDVTGLAWPLAKRLNSREIQISPKVRSTSRTVGGAASRPKIWGITTRRLRSATWRAKAVTKGVMPGISLMTNTAGPSPIRYTSRVIPLAVNGLHSKSLRMSELFLWATVSSVS